MFGMLIHIVQQSKPRSTLHYSSENYGEMVLSGEDDIASKSVEQSRIIERFCS